MDLSVTIGGVYFPSILSNAAGTIKTVEQARKVARSASGCVRGSYMFDERPGNSGRVFWESENKLFSVNSLGIPGPGYGALKKLVPQMVDIAHANGKPLVLSIAGTSPEEYGHMAMLLDYGADMLELNAGCPNLYFAGTQKPILSYHPESLRESLQKMSKTIGAFRMELIGVKVSPFDYSRRIDDLKDLFGIELKSTPPGLEIFDEVVEIVKQSGVSHVVAINTIPNAFVLAEDGKPAINSPEVSSGCGGLAGEIIYAIALEEVSRWREALPESIIVVAVGGIIGGWNLENFLHIGHAEAVQIGTAFYRDEDPRVFGRILDEYLDVITGERGKEL